MEFNIALIFLCLIGPIIGYLFGSFLFAIYIPKLITKKDIRLYGSKNPGFTNTTRVFGFKIGLIVLLLDILKTIIPTLIIYFIVTNFCKNSLNLHSSDNFNPLMLIYLTGGFAVLGHLFPIYHKFKGGKGIASIGGLFLITSPLISLTAAIIIICCILAVRYVSLGSIICLIVCPFLVLIPAINYPYLVYSDFVNSINITINHTLILLPLFFEYIILAALIIYKHKTNIHNLINKTEKKIA